MKKHAKRKGLIKEPVDSDRIRRLPAQFEPLDRRLLYEKHLCGMTHEQIALYVLLALASDREGLSYYSDARITRLLRIEPARKKWTPLGVKMEDVHYEKENVRQEVQGRCRSSSDQ